MSHLTVEGACRGIFSTRFTEFACDKVMTDGKVKIYRKSVFLQIEKNQCSKETTQGCVIASAGRNIHGI